MATQWMTAKEVAAYLGCCEESVWRMRRDGKLPARPHGTRSWRFDRATVEAMGKGEAAPEQAELVALIDERIRAFFRQLLEAQQVK